MILLPPPLFFLHCWARGPPRMAALSWWCAVWFSAPSVMPARVLSMVHLQNLQGILDRWWPYSDFFTFLNTCSKYIQSWSSVKINRGLIYCMLLMGQRKWGRQSSWLLGLVFTLDVSTSKWSDVVYSRVLIAVLSLGLWGRFLLSDLATVNRPLLTLLTLLL